MAQANLDQDIRNCNEALDVVRKCVDHCRSLAEKSQSIACKSTLFCVAFCCEGSVKAIEKCIELCRGDESKQKVA